MSTKKTAANSTAIEAKTTASETVKAAEKKTAAKTAKPAAEKKPAAAKTAKAAKPAAEKTAAAKTETKAAPAKKTAAKTTAKTAAKSAPKTASKPAAAKKPAKKAAPVVSAETICAKLEKKLSKTKIAAVKEKIAVDIEIYGFTEGDASQKMYIEVNEGKAVVSPHSYDTKDFRVAVSLDKALAFVDGKLALKDLITASEGFYAEGNIAKAVKLAAIL